MAGGYLPRDTLSQGLADARTDLNALLAAEKSIAEYRLQSEINLAVTQQENIKARYALEQKVQDAVFAKQEKMLKQKDADYLKKKKALEKEAEKYSKEEFKKKLEELKTLHDQEIKDLKESDEFKKKLAKKEAAERTKEGRKITGELAKGITGISGDNKLGQLKNGLSAAFHNKEGGLDIAQGLQATTQAIAEFARQLDGTVEKIASQKGIIDTNLQGSRRSTGGAFGIGGSY